MNIKKNILLLAFLCTVISSFAQKIYVSSSAEGQNNGTSWYDAYTDLNDAIAKAENYVNSNPGHTIDIWVAGGNYHKQTSTSKNSSFTLSPGISLYGGFVGYEITFNQRNLALNVYTILSGDDSCRVLSADIPLSSAPVYIDGFYLQSGNSTALSNTEGSGALLKGNVFIRNCHFINCKGNSTVCIDHSAYTLTTPIKNLSNVVFESNYCTAIHNLSDYVFCDSITITNQSNGNAALLFSGSHSSVTHASIKSNSVKGAILSNGATLLNSYIQNNQDVGISASKRSKIVNCVITNNNKYGIVSDSSYIINVTVASNGGTSSSTGAGIYTHNDSIYNSIIWGNKNSTGYSQIEFYNSSDTCINYCDIQGGMKGSNNFDLYATSLGLYDPHYPVFVNPTTTAGAGTEEGRWLQLLCAHKINTGSLSSIPHCITMPTTDVRGEARIFDEGEDGLTYNDTIDRGPYENDYHHNPSLYTHDIIYVSEGGKGIKDGSSWTDAMDNVCEAIVLAGKIANTSNRIMQVWISEGTYYGLEDTHNAFYMIGNVYVYGGFAGTEAYNYDLTKRDFNTHISILDGENNKRVVYQLYNLPEGQQSIFDGFTIQNGYTSPSSSDPSPQGAGVALRCHGILSNCVIKNNHTIGTVSTAEGGGVYSFRGGKIINCKILNNYSNNFAGGVALNDTSLLINSIVANNEAFGTGYGVRAMNHSIVINTTIVSNKSANSNGALYLYGSSSCINNIIWGNTGIGSLSIVEDHVSNTISYSAIEGGYSGVGNLVLSSDNDGDNANFNYPRFINPGTTTGNISNASLLNSNWGLKYNSDCVDTGITHLLLTTYNKDLANKNRINGEKVDLGGYELPSPSLHYKGIIYVTPDGTGNGNSWTDAMGDLNYATELASAFNLKTTPSVADSNRVDVWVKHGTYYGNGIACNPAFKLLEKVDVFGSFVGNEPTNYDVTKREYNLYPSILDGQHKQRVLLQNSGNCLNPSETNYKYGFSSDKTSIWDGFTLQNGYTDCDQEHTTILNNHFTDKIAKQRNRGAGAYLEQNGFLSNCRILDNETTMKIPDSVGYGIAQKVREGWGAGVFLSGQSTLYNCLINGNKSASRCGGVYADWNSTILNCVITNNESYGIGSTDYDTTAPSNPRGGAGVYAYNSYIINTTIANNKLYADIALPNVNGAGAFLFANGTSNTGSDRIDFYNNIVWGNQLIKTNGTADRTYQIKTFNNKAYNIFHNAVEGEISFQGIGSTVKYGNKITLDPLNDGNAVSAVYPRFIFPCDSVGIVSNKSLYINSNWSLRGTSDLINTGSNLLYYNISKYATDLGNNSRIILDTIDLGAYEFTFCNKNGTESVTHIFVRQTGNGDGLTWQSAFGDIQTAIDTAYAINQRFGHDSVDVWVAGGEYIGNQVAGDNAFTLKDGVQLYGGFYGYNETSLDQRDPKANPTILNGRNAQRVLYQQNGFQDSTVVDGFVIENGYLASGNGAGAYINGNSNGKDCDIVNCVFKNNTTGNGIGGGLYANKEVNIINCDFTQNKATNGSACALNGTIMIGCSISKNTSTSANGYAVIADSSATLKSNTIQFNIGGGITATHKSNISTTKVVGNTGRGIFSTDSVNLINILVTNNGHGGVQLTNKSNIFSSTVVRNYSTDEGAGVDINNGKIISTAIWGNKKGTKANQIKAGNGCTVKFTAVQDSLISISGTAITTVYNNISLDSNNMGNKSGHKYPFFSKVCDSVGVLSAYTINRNKWSLLPNSSFYNIGADTMGVALPDTDLAGNIRINFGRIDIGAYELQWPKEYLYGKIYVTETGAGNMTGVNWENAMADFQVACDIANYTGYPVWVAKGNYYGDTTLANAFIIKEGIKVYGSFDGTEPNNYDLSARHFSENISYLNGYHTQRVLNQTTSFSDTTILDGFTVINGKTTGNGAGAYIINNVQLNHFNFTENEANGVGGGLYAEHALSLLKSKFTNNSATAGGGVYADSLTLINCLLANNSATAGNGGGVYTGNGSILISNTITNNFATGDGGGLFLHNSGSQHNILTDNVLWGNKVNSTRNQLRYTSNDEPYITYNAIQQFSLLSAQHNLKLDTNNHGHTFGILYPFFEDINNGVVGKTTTNGVWQLSIGSACINAGTLSTAVTLPTSDLNDLPRVANHIIDIGAYENKMEDFNYEIIHVTTTGAGLFTGEIWDNAMDDIDLAAYIASKLIDTNTGRHPKVWVAVGNYTNVRDGHNEPFIMEDGVQVFGGFEGVEDPHYDLSQRNMIGTVLDAQNSNRCLYQNTNFDTSSTWDGFVLKNGYIDGNGAGAYLRKNGALKNVTFYYCDATGNGGGLYTVDSSYVQADFFGCKATNGGGAFVKDAILDKCRFLYDTATVNGGAIYASESYIVNSGVFNNVGGGIYAIDKTHIINTTVTENSIANTSSPITTGSGILFDNSTSILNTVAWNNVRGASDYTNQITQGMPNVVNCALQGDATRAGSNGNFSLEATNVRTSADFSRHYPEFSGTGVNRHLTPFSSMINAGNTVLPTLPSSIDFTTDFFGKARVHADTIDIGFSEYALAVITKPLCKDSICQTNAKQIVSCSDTTFTIPSTDANTVASYFYENYSRSHDTAYVHSLDFKVLNQPEHSITAHDVSINGLTDLTSALTGYNSQTLYWSIDATTYSQTQPSIMEDVTYYCFSATPDIPSCHTDTLQFKVLPNCNLDLSHDTIHLCLNETISVTYNTIAGIQISMDSTKCILDTTTKIITAKGLGRSVIKFFKQSCINDSIVIFIHENPVIAENDFNLYQTDGNDTILHLISSMTGTWSGGDASTFSINSTSGKITRTNPAVGLYHFYFTSTYGCTDSISIAIVPNLGACVLTISNINELHDFRDAVNNGTDYQGASGAYGFSGCTIYQLKPIGPKEDWIPIGTSTRPFRGVYFGNNQNNDTINPITELEVIGDKDTVGFFGYINGATLNNVRVLTNFTYGVNGGNLVGGIVGLAVNSKIINCGNGVAINGKSNVGGICGKAVNTPISECLNVATIYATDSIVGGIVGSSNDSIGNCYNTGWIHAKSSTANIGGICGNTSDTIKYCLNTGAIGDLRPVSYEHYGAICGSATHTSYITHCAWDKQIGTTPKAIAFGSPDTSNIKNLYTQDMLGTRLGSLLNNSAWLFGDSLYPQLNHLSGASIGRISACPVILLNHTTINAVPDSFIVYRFEIVQWFTSTSTGFTYTVDDLTYSVKDSSNPSQTYYGRTSVEITPTVLAQFKRFQCADTSHVFYLKSTRQYHGYPIKEIPMYIEHSNAQIEPSVVAIHDTVHINSGENLSLLGTPSTATSYTWSYIPKHAGTSSFISAAQAHDSLVSGSNLSKTNEGWYYLTTTSLSCGTSKDSVYVKIKSPIEESYLNLCSGESGLVHLEIKSSGTWSSSDITTATVTYLNDSTATVTAVSTTNDTCVVRYSGNTDSVTIIVKATPNAILTADNTTVCNNNATTLTAATGISGVNYEWQHYDGSVWQTVQNSTTNTYMTPTLSSEQQYRVVSTLNGCAATSAPIIIHVFGIATSKISVNGVEY